MLDVKLPAPEIVTTEIPVRELYEALEENGFEHIRGTWSDGKGGCVLMQTAWNLDVIAVNDMDISAGYAPDKPEYFSKDYPAWEQRYAETSNKITQYTLEKQLNRWSLPSDSKWVDKYLQQFSEGGVGIGSAIIYWNDKREIDPKTGGLGYYSLATYKDVAKMAYDLLSPHFDETVSLIKYEYPNKPAKKSY